MQKFWIILGSLALFIIVTGISWFIFTLNPPPLANHLPLPSPTPTGPDLSPTSIPTPSKDNAKLNLALLGYGGAGHQGGYLTDVIMVAHFDFQNKVLALISIPRDLWLTYPDGIARKINAAYVQKTNLDNYPKTTLDSPTAKNAAVPVKSALETITGLPITYFIGVDFSGFERLINSLGGVKVVVTKALDDPFYPVRGRELELCGFTPEAVTQMTATMSGFTLEKQFTCRYERVKYDPGTYQMSGEAALKFARSRHSSSDFDRSERQQALLIGLKDKLISLGALDKLPQFFQELSTIVRTDLTSDFISYLSPNLRSLTSMRLLKINLTTANVLTNSTSGSGAFILIPKAGANQWQAVHQYVLQELAKLP